MKSEMLSKEWFTNTNQEYTQKVKDYHFMLHEDLEKLVHLFNINGKEELLHHVLRTLYLSDDAFVNNLQIHVLMIFKKYENIFTKLYIVGCMIDHYS